MKKLSLSMPFRIWMEKGFTDLGLTLMPINLAHSDKQVGLDFHHKDPFDRILIAQALVEGISLISIDSIFDQYGVTRIW
jgi:PIN domain nuclease of toxin-antitoxin system